MAGAATNHLNSYPLLIVGKVLAAIGDGSLDNAQHRIFATYFSPGRGFAFSIGMSQFLPPSLALTPHLISHRHMYRCHLVSVSLSYLLM